MTYRGTQWKVTPTALQRISDGWHISRDDLRIENDYGIGPIYECFGHVADTKDFLDLIDFLLAFRAAWRPNRLGPIDEAKLALSMEQADILIRRRRILI